MKTGIPENFTECWRVSRKNFGNEITFYAPSLKHFETSELRQTCDCFFAAVSITGSKCSLMCDHCRARILSSMKQASSGAELLEIATILENRGAKGLLVSGGSDNRGVVPLYEYLGAIKEIKRKTALKVLIHTGITDEELAHGLAEAEIDLAMLDVIGSEETIEHVYHLERASVSSYEQSMANLDAAGVSMAPHVVVGLHYGELKGERRALDMIKQFPVNKMVIVGLLPMPGTPMERIEPPGPEEFGEIFLYARRHLPATEIMLGCERPWGEHKVETDKLAVWAGLNGIAYPSEGVIEFSRKLGLEPRISEMCCAL